MSEQAKKDEIQISPLTDVPFDMDDTRHLRDFFTHFKIPVPEAFTKALDEFDAMQKVHRGSESPEAVALCNRVRNELMSIFVTSDHKVIKDEIWNEVKDTAKKILFHANFDKEVEEICKVD